MTIWEGVVSVFTDLLPSVLLLKEKISNKNELAEFEKEYKKMRLDIAFALSFHACCYSNPIDIAKIPDHQLPQDYEKACDELRKLGAKASALAATLPEKERHLPISKNALIEVSKNLIWLSNSLYTPYNCDVSYNHAERIAQHVKEIRMALGIEISEKSSDESPSTTWAKFHNRLKNLKSCQRL